jgi:predicted RNA binding protein YcfA (HicA-like mRNA interferase family)
MSRLPSVTGRQVIAALNRMGFQEIRVRGSHHYLRHTDGRATVVPVPRRRNDQSGLLSKILRDAEITREDFELRL